MRKMLVIASLFALFGRNSESAQAGGVQFYVGTRYGGIYSGSPSYGNSYYGNSYYGGSYGYSRGGRAWHDTSHYDYHPGGYAPHRNHYDYVPGHYDYHQTGHWDRVRGGHHGHRH